MNIGEAIRRYGDRFFMNIGEAIRRYGDRIISLLFNI